MLVVTFATSGPFGQARWLWLVPQQYLITGLTQSAADSQKRPAARQSLEQLIGEMPVELSVRLGETELPVSQLTRLRAGDLVILDQRVSQPLQACVGGHARFQGWPGRVGPRRAFQIDSLVDS
jgi:flagellar motor switch protein FliM